MTAWAALAIVAASVVAMEAVAALVHRFWMHGPGWAWHRSHHEPARGRLERNDRYAIVFAAVAVALIAAGQHGGPPALLWVGTGMTVYGVLYALVHDGLVHRRFPWPRRWATPRRGYLARLAQAHRLHHATRGRDGAVSFGFLYAAPPRRLAAALRARRAGSAATPPAFTGLALAALIAAAWAALLGYGLFGHAWGGAVSWALAAAVVALLAWLEVGLFIVGHDAMHGTLAPRRPRLNRALGRVALLLYAGFGFDRFAARHRDHHRWPGGDGDPDFHAGDARFWRWYLAFLRRYVGAREIAGMAALAALLALVSSPLRAALFWLLPALLASLQLFAFGTWLPHRPREADAFVDAHRARSNRYGTLASLASCFHFGYHLEHHRHPHEPWWRLPAVYRAARAGQANGLPRGEGSQPAGPTR